MTEREKSDIVYAREMSAFSYFLQMLPDGWTATRTPGEFDGFDLWTTNNTETIAVENKVRDKDADEVRDGGCLINKEKIDNLIATGGKAAVVQYFWKNNETYVWSISERDTWRTGTIWVKKKNWDDSPYVQREVYYMPMDAKHRRKNVDLRDYQARYNHYLKEAQAR